jgi:acylphosphatase
MEMTRMVSDVLMEKRIRALIEGKVQGVFYRANAKKEASALGLKGFIRNLNNGSVELEAEGEETKLEDLLRWCKHGPPGAKVTNVLISWISPNHGEKSFEIVT